MSREALPPPIPQPESAGRTGRSPARGVRSLSASVAVHALLFAALGLWLATRVLPPLWSGQDGAPARTASLPSVVRESRPELWTPEEPEPELDAVPDTSPEPELVEIEPPPLPEPTFEPEVELEWIDTTIAPPPRHIPRLPPREPEPSEPPEDAAPDPSEAGEPEAGLIDDRGPVLLSNPKPAYPKAALRLGQEGSVRLRIEVDASGAVTNVSVVESSRFPLLDDAAVEAARGWSFEPAVRSGREVPDVFDYRVTFRLSQAGE